MGEEHEGEPRDGEEIRTLLLPVVPEELKLDPLLLALLRCSCFLDLSGEDGVDAQLAGEVLEHVGLYIQRLPDERLDELQAQLASLECYGSEQGWSEDLIEFIRDFLYNCGLGEDENGDGKPVGDV